MKKIAEGFSGERAIITPYNIRRQQQNNESSKMLYLTHIGYYPTAKFHYRERKEGAAENIFIYCIEGEGWLQTEYQKVSIKKNHCFILPAHQYHTYGANKQNPWSLYWFHFRGEQVPLFSSIIGKVIYIENSEDNRFGDRLSLIQEMYENLEMGYSPENLEYANSCLYYFLSSIKYPNQYRRISNVKKMNVVQRSILFMKENLEHKLTLEDIARNVGYSPSRFGTIFTTKTSFPPMAYYNQLKIQKACFYLQFTELKIKEIAYKLNFYDPFHFSKTFSKEMGLTPKTYRTRYQKDYTPIYQ